MIDWERDELDQNPHWRTVLHAYEPRQNLPPGAEGWIERVQNVDDIEDAALPRIHGQLIALGLLRFQVAGRETGVCYQLSTLGQRLLLGGRDGHDARAGTSEPDEE